MQAIKVLRLGLHSSFAEEPYRIGYLSQLGQTSRLHFEPGYVLDVHRPLLSLSLRGASQEDTQRILSSTTDARLVRTDGLLPNFLRNLLPQPPGREHLAQLCGCSAADEFALLAGIGKDLRGALSAQPLEPHEKLPELVARAWGPDLAESAQHITAVAPAAGSFVPAGMGVKFAAVLEGTRLRAPAAGELSTHVVKLATAQHPDLVENEYFGYLLCRELEVNCTPMWLASMSEVELPPQLSTAGSSVLVAQRIDRLAGGKRLHFEDFAQVLRVEPDGHLAMEQARPFAQMLRVLYELSDHPMLDVAEALDRFVVLRLLGAADAHLRNWALVYPDGRTPRLAPVYDTVSVSAALQQAGPEEYPLFRALEARSRNFSWNDFEAMLRQAQLLRASLFVRRAKELVKAAQAKWPAILGDAPAGLRDAVLERINGGLALTRK